MLQVTSSRLLAIAGLVVGTLVVSSHAHVPNDVDSDPVLLAITTTLSNAKKQAESPLFPVPDTGMLIKGGSEGQGSLREFLRDFGTLTGETFLYDEETAAVLSAAKPGLDGDIRVDAKDMYSVMQSLLLENRLALVDVRRSEPRLLKVVGIDTRGGQILRSSATFVPESEVAGFAENSAMLITTCVRLPHLNETQAASNLRPMALDSKLERIMAIPGSRQVILTAPAGQVAEWVELLRDLDRNAESLEPQGE